MTINWQDRRIRVFSIVCGATLFIYLVLVIFAPEQTSSEPERPRIQTQLMVIKARDYQIQMQTYGQVQPKISNKLVAEVSGKIVKVSEDFRPGGRFQTEQALVWLDDRDYRHSITLAKSQLARARSDLALEEANVTQAKRDWQRLNQKDQASYLTLREPQLNRAKSEQQAMEANLSLAELKLERSIIRAPYDGRIRNILVDVGQVVPVGTPLANVFATDQLEIRLPILLEDIKFLPANLNEAMQSPSESTPTDSSDAVQLVATGKDTRQWQAKLLRTEATLDAASHQYYAVAQVEGIMTENVPQAYRRPIVGQYLNANIPGKWLMGAIVIPTTAIYRNEYVWVVDEQQNLRQRPIDILWQNKIDAIIERGLDVGDRLVLNRLGYALEGAATTPMP